MAQTTAANFSETYAEARSKFLEAAKAAGASLESFQNTDAKGPDGEALYTDVARLGPAPGNARAVLFATSGTHGAEGYCGSGCQVGALRDGQFADLPADTAVVLTHAINPYGFCWGRRVNESNIDLNRNYVDHDAEYPDDKGYGDIHGFTCPPDLMEKKQEWDTKLFEWLGEHSLPAFQEAVSSGQYSYPDGLFYGGAAPSWSNKTWRNILATQGAGAEKVIFIDFHTGLGPSGYGEMIGLGDQDAVGRACSVWGDGEVTNLQDGSSSSAVVRGDMGTVFFDILSNAWAAAIALEYGTLDMVTVLDGLRQDNWLYAHGDRDSELGRQIVANSRACFYTETDEWKAQVSERATWAFAKAFEALSA